MGNRIIDNLGSINWDRWIALVALVLSVYTCNESKRIEKKNDSSNSVSTLVGYIQRSSIDFGYYNNNSTYRNTATLFELNESFINDNNKDSRVFFPQMRKLTTMFESHFEKDPYMPIEIINALKPFRVGGKGWHIPNRKDGFVLIYDSNDYKEHQLKTDSSYIIEPEQEFALMSSSSGDAYTTFENFVKASIELKKAIKKWNKDNDANIQIVED